MSINLHLYKEIFFQRLQLKPVPVDLVNCPSLCFSTLTKYPDFDFSRDLGFGELLVFTSEILNPLAEWQLCPFTSRDVVAQFRHSLRTFSGSFSSSLPSPGAQGSYPAARPRCHPAGPYGLCRTSLLEQSFRRTAQKPK